DLPMVGGAGRATWSISFGGVLSIEEIEDGVIDTLWASGADNLLTKYWGPVRSIVKRVEMDPNLKTRDMRNWFRDMGKLTNTAGIFIPEGCSDVSEVFRSAGVTQVADDFTFPNSVLSLSSAVYGPPLPYLPSSFTLPSQASDLSGMFQESGISALPENFTVPGSVTTMAQMFKNCLSLNILPSSFKISENQCNVSELFSGCSLLQVLPDGFSIPQNVTNMDGVFLGCNALTAFPSSFDFPLATAEAAKDPFVCSMLIDTIYEGNKDSVLNYSRWETSNRKLVRALPGGRYLASFILPDDSGSYKNQPTWATITTDENGKIAEPVAPKRTAQVFTQWYADEACEKRIDFSKPIVDQVKANAEGRYNAYGRYVAGLLGGSLPTVSGSGNAWWSLSDEGGLFIGGSGTVNLSLPDSHTDPGADLAWGSYRTQVKSITMSPGLDVQGMNNWFRDMTSLVDCDGFFIPKSTTTLRRAFMGCTALESLPEGLIIPDTVTSLVYVFYGCSALRSLPSTFVFSDKSTLAYLTYAFKGCASLSSLPAGFKIPTSVEIMIEAFKDCSSLTILPSSFDFPAQASTASAFACDLVDGKRLTTYYSGSSATVLNYDWTSQNRTLVANSEDRGMYEVAYKVQAPTEPFAWETRSTVLTDKNGIATDPGSPSLEGYTFTGWSTDEECLEPFDFSTTLTSATTLYGKWIKHGGINSEEGKLPTEMPDGTKGFDAWWRITADGTFVIGTKNPEATLQSFGWEYVYPGDTWTPSENYWSVYSSEVTKVIMLEGIKTTSTAQWFRAMTHLTDVSRVYIPEGTVDASFMFDGAMSLKALPADFALPESVERVVAMFRTCESLEVLPNNFRLPKNVITVNSMFAATLALTTLPETLLLSENVEDAAYYLSKSGISSLPSNFRIPSSVKSVFRLLDQCKNLTALPEGFGFDTPQNVVNVERMLEDTAKMTSLPASFELNGLSQEAKEGKLVDGVLVHGGWANMLGFRNEKPTTPITTYYAGNPANIPTDTELFWTNQKRALVTSMPAGCYQGSFLLPDDSGQYSDVWIKPLTDTAGVLTEPVAPVRAGQVFLGWYTDASCTTKFDFTKALTANATIYGKYYALSGALPTEASPNNTDLSVASWKLLSDGTLSIDCAKGEILADF
ncbi:MAG: InlB B-repeat-containing protein, partial [Raoultibacter sp.]